MRVLFLALAPSLVIGPQGITEILRDGSADSGGNVLLIPRDVAMDAAGNLFVSGAGSDNVFRLAPDGGLKAVIDSSGDGQGNILDAPIGIAVDAAGNLYVAAVYSDNAFRVEPSGTITELIDGSGDGLGHPLIDAYDIAVDGLGNVYVVGYTSNNVFRISPDGSITQVLDSSGDGVHPLEGPPRVSALPDGVVYVSGYLSNNLFRLDPAGNVEQILDASGVGPYVLYSTYETTYDAAGNVYVGSGSDNAFRIAPDGTVSLLVGFQGDGQGNHVTGPYGVVADPFGNVYVASAGSDRVFRVTATGTVTMIMDPSGDGTNPMDFPFMMELGHDSELYVVGLHSHNVYRIDGCSPVPATAAVRNGSGVNPAVYAESTPAVLGTYWTTTVDLAGASASLIQVSTQGPLPGIPTLFGELLCALPFSYKDVAAGEHAIALPFDCSLVGRALWTQAARIRLSPFGLELTNALDVTIGTTD